MSIVLYSILLKFLGLSWILSVILYSNGAFCSERDSELYPLSIPEKTKDKINIILTEKEPRPVEAKRNLRPIINSQDFLFKNLIEGAYVDFEKVRKGLKEHKTFHKQLLEKLESLIKQSSPNSKLVEYLNSDLFNYRIKYYLLDEFKDLLVAKERWENEIGDYFQAVVTLIVNLRDINSSMPEIKSFFAFRKKNPNAKIFKNLCDCICLYKREIEKIINHHNFFADWMTENKISAAYVKEHIETYYEKNNVILNYNPSSIYLGKKKIEHQQDLRKSISELLHWYYGL